MYRVAIIGAGIGAEHLQAYRALPDRFRVTMLCDRDIARARALAGTGDGPACVAQIDEVLSDPSVDIVDVCLPPTLHAPVTIRALEAGKHVVCEKPLATSLSDVDAIATAEAASGRRVFPVFQYRYGPGWAALCALASAPFAGHPIAATLETHWCRLPDYYANGWRGTWKGEAGGAILCHAIHIHDLLTTLLGPVAEVHAFLSTSANPIETEDTAALSIRMKNGALVTSSVTLGAADDTSRLRFVFEGFTAESGRAPYAPSGRGWTFAARRPEDQARIDALVASADHPDTGFAGYVRAVADALDGAGAEVVTLADGRDSVEFVTAVYASARSGRPVSLPLPSDHPDRGGWPDATWPGPVR